MIPPGSDSGPGEATPSRPHYRETTFHGELILLDGHRFKRCVFRDCHLLFRGTAPVELTECRTEGETQWLLNGHAALTLEYLQAFYHGGGEGARQLVEDLFAQVRNGTWPTHPHP